MPRCVACVEYAEGVDLGRALEALEALELEALEALEALEMQGLSPVVAGATPDSVAELTRQHCT